MDKEIELIIFLLSIFSLFGVLFAMIKLFDRIRVEQRREAANRLGLTYDDLGDWTPSTFSGLYEDHDVSMRSFVRLRNPKSGRSKHNKELQLLFISTRLSRSGAQSVLPSFTIHLATSNPILVNRVYFQDPNFDERFEVHCEAEEAVRALLTAEVRAEILRYDDIRRSLVSPRMERIFLLGNRSELLLMDKNKIHCTLSGQASGKNLIEIIKAQHEVAKALCGEV